MILQYIFRTKKRMILSKEMSDTCSHNMRNEYSSMLSMMTLCMETQKLKVMRLITSIYFDSDCISSFLWVKEETILHDLYQKKLSFQNPFIMKYQRLLI